jgi:N utilization substance protein B
MMVQSRNKDPRHISSARLVAVQALYEVEITEAKCDSVLLDFKEKRWLKPSVYQNEGGNLVDLATPDKKKFNKIINGVSKNIHDIDKMLSGALKKEREIQNLDIVLRSILRAGIFELFFQRDVPVRVIIDEYVELTRAFYSEKEPYFVNGVMDNIAKLVRVQEL